jgi:hypothetical protein
MYDNWMRATYSSSTLDVLQLKAHEIMKRDIDYYEAIEVEYKKKVERMEGDL